MKVIFIFIDGLGIGESDAVINPVFAAKTPALDYIMNNYKLYPTDASLGVPGLPQSATGQTAIFTGVNASKVLNRHLSGQPTETLRKIIYEDNIFKRLIQMGFKVTNSNVYRQEYLDKILGDTDTKFRPSVTTVMTHSCGLRFRNVEDFKNGNGVYHDLTGNIIKESGYDVVPITPEESAERVYNISREFDFTLYEHFMTDIIGHLMDFQLSVRHMEIVDAFLGKLLGKVDLDRDIIVITSDHGNIEDATIKTHTSNKVPTIFVTRRKIDVKIETLTDIMPAVVGLF